LLRCQLRHVSVLSPKNTKAAQVRRLFRCFFTSLFSGTYKHTPTPLLPLRELLEDDDNACMRIIRFVFLLLHNTMEVGKTANYFEIISMSVIPFLPWRRISWTDRHIQRIFQRHQATGILASLARHKL